MLKSKIDKAAFDALPDVLKAEYKESNGSYLLETDDAAELRAAKLRQSEELRTAKEAQQRAETEAATARAAAEAAAAEAARKAGDIPAIEASWQAKVEAEKQAGASAIAKMKGVVDKLLVDKEAIAICAEISNSPELLLPHVKSLLVAEYEGDEPKTRILGDDGKPSAKTIEEFKTDLIANPKFAAIIIGSKASGGAGNQRPAPGGAVKKISEMNEGERVAHYNRVGQVEFDRQAAAEKAVA